ncbi:MAG: hypothetical protein NVSMB18_27940 [Acetobacteraceae bacterium]
MATTVIALVGENANGILECQSQRFLDLLPALGLEGRVLNLRSSTFVAQLDAALQQGVSFAWGYAGVGANLAISGRNIWSATGIPFISVLADAPYIMPGNHHIASANVVNGYVYPDWLAFQQRHIRSAQISTLIPMGVIPNPASTEIPWSARPQRMLFVKTGSDPVRQRAGWAAWPARLRPILHDCADALASQKPGPIAPTVQACLEAHALFLDGSRPMLFGLLHELDTYIRALRATAVVRALLPLPVDIVGDGWAHVRQDGRARFHPAISASDLEAQYARTQILINVTPNVAHGAHERVLRGFASRCCIASDSNAHAEATFATLPSYHGFDWHEPDLADRLAAIFHDPTPYDELLDQAQAYVERNHDSMAFLQRLVELAQLARMQSTMAGYALEAA